MWFSKASEYGVRLALHLADGEPEGYVSIRRLADRLDVPFHFLCKVCRQLTRNGILTSYRGPNGGVMLGRPADAITLREVIEATEGTLTFDRCIFGLCEDTSQCVLCPEWTRMRRQLEAQLFDRSLRDLADGLAERGFPLRRR